MTDMQEWVRRRAKQDRRLYELYGKPLEAEHTGEYVAIGPNGEIILGKDDLDVGRKALDRFGSGNFALRKVGHPAVWKWRRLG